MTEGGRMGTAAGKTGLVLAGSFLHLAVVTLTLLAFWLLLSSLEPPAGVTDPGSRLALWARLALWPAWFLMATVTGVLFARVASVAFNPIDDAESRLYRISQRVLTNTVEQTLIFLPALAALAVLLPLPDLAALRVATILFIAGRLLFWCGYLIHPYVRAPGMAMTLTVNLLVLGWSAWLAL